MKKYKINEIQIASGAAGSRRFNTLNNEQAN